MNRTFWIIALAFFAAFMITQKIKQEKQEAATTQAQVQTTDSKPLPKCEDTNVCADGMHCPEGMICKGTCCIFAGD